MANKLLCDCGQCHYCVGGSTLLHNYSTRPIMESTIVFDVNGKMKVEQCILLRPDTAKGKVGTLNDRTFCECVVECGSFSDIQPGLLMPNRHSAALSNSFFHSPLGADSISESAKQFMDRFL